MAPAMQVPSTSAMGSGGHHAGQVSWVITRLANPMSIRQLVK